MLCPTRELATQIHQESAKLLTFHQNLSIQVRAQTRARHPPQPHGHCTRACPLICCQAQAHRRLQTHSQLASPVVHPPPMACVARRSSSAAPT